MTVPPALTGSGESVLVIERSVRRWIVVHVGGEIRGRVVVRRIGLRRGQLLARGQRRGLTVHRGRIGVQAERELVDDVRRGAAGRLRGRRRRWRGRTGGVAAGGQAGDDRRVLEPFGGRIP